MRKVKLIRILKKLALKRKMLFSVSSCICVLATIFIIYMIRLPLKVTEQIFENNIVLDTIFFYQSDIKPFALNPKGGITDLNNSTFTNVTKDIILHIKSSVNSDKPIKIEGTKKVVLKLIAEELWIKEYVLSSESSFHLEGSRNYIFDDKYAINLDQIVNFVKEMEDDIKISPGNYKLEITPVIKGTIISGDEVLPIEHNANTYFTYTESQITLGEENPFSKSIPIIKTSVLPQFFNFLGLKIPMLIAKIIFIVIYLIIITLYSILIYSIIKSIPKSSEILRIDKKYKARLFPILEEVNTSLYNKIILDSFVSLVKISDEKDTIILKYNCEYEKRISYYVIDGLFVFVYQIASEIDEKENQLKLQY